MEPPSSVLFRNVGLLYFPHTRVECHYRLSSEHQWSSSDWIGVFQIGWSSIKNYYTYTWAVVPEGYTEGTDVDSSAPFHPFYLPLPSAVEYQFVYVDRNGRVCARSRAFTFSTPKPLEELETVKEEREEEDGEEELLLVIPRAQLLQTRLDECLRKQEELQRALGETSQEAEWEKEKVEMEKTEWERERGLMKEEISELRENLRQVCELQRKEQGKDKDVKYTEENLAAALSKLKSVKAESEQQILEQQKNLRALTERDKQNSNELERLKERLKKISNQIKRDEEKRKCLQTDRDSALMDVRGLQDRLEVSDHVTECLRRELRELGTRQSHIHAELHQARMQVAQLSLQLSEENLQLREERANRALEREAFKQAAEISKKKLQDLSCELERKEEWLQEERMEKERLELGLSIEKDKNKEVISPTFYLEQQMVSESPLFCVSDTESNEDTSSTSPRSVTAHLVLEQTFSRVDGATQGSD